MNKQCPICQEPISEEDWICKLCVGDMPMNCKMAIVMFKGDVSVKMIERWTKTGHWDGCIEDPSTWKNPIQRFKKI